MERPMTNLTEYSGWRMVSISAPRPTAKWIAARMMALLSHYYQPQVDEGIDELAMTDWIMALGDIPQQAVADACQDWLRNETRRPTPADIRRKAEARIERPAPPSEEAEPFAPAVISLDERRERMTALSELYRDLMAKAAELNAPKDAS